MAKKLQKYVYSGALQLLEKEVDVDIMYASKSSLFVRSLNGFKPQNGDSFENLKLNLNKRDIELGKCKFFSTLKTPSFDGQLVFTDDVYDFYETFSHGRIINLRTYFQNLPVILLQKDKIKPEFKEYCGSLIYDLNAYRSFFDKVDSEFQSEDQKSLKRIQEITIEIEGKNYFEYFDKRLDELAALVRDFTPDEHHTHGFYFRRQLWGIISASIFMLRTNLKPRGYAGDSKTLAIIYENEYLGDSIFEKLMHKHPLENAAARAVRNRRVFVADEFRKLRLQKNNKKKKLRVMSVACGPAAEIEDLIETKDDAQHCHFTLLDQDNEALWEAEENIKRRQRTLNTEIDYFLFPESVRTLIRVKDLPKQIGTFDYIYSMGLYDYLTDRIASALTKKLYELLLPGGTLLIGNYHIDNPSCIYMEYWLDWVLYYRSESELLAIADDLPDAEIKIVFEESGSQMFLLIKKG